MPNALTNTKKNNERTSYDLKPNASQPYKKEAGIYEIQAIGPLLPTLIRFKIRNGKIMFWN